jgi:hypothetical protein
VKGIASGFLQNALQGQGQGANANQQQNPLNSVIGLFGKKKQQQQQPTAPK